jgi:ABC-2 type transport system permease protein
MSHELTAIYFMWKRELIRFYRSKSRIAGSLGMPFFFLAILGTGLNGALNMPGLQGNYLEFIAPGILAMVLLFGSIFAGIIVIMDRQFGFLKETLVAPVSRTSLVIGKALGGASTAVIQGVLMLVIALLLGVQINLAGLPLAIALMLFISTAFVALGIAIASRMEDMHGFQLVSNFLVMPMFFLSGALFPLFSAPKIVQYVSMVNPLTYAVESLRFVLVGQSTMPIMLSLGVLVLFFLLCAFAAVYLFNRMEE